MFRLAVGEVARIIDGLTTARRSCAVAATLAVALVRSRATSCRHVLPAQSHKLLQLWASSSCKNLRAVTSKAFWTMIIEDYYSNEAVDRLQITNRPLLQAFFIHSKFYSNFKRQLIAEPSSRMVEFAHHLTQLLDSQPSIGKINLQTGHQALLAGFAARVL